MKKPTVWTIAGSDSGGGAGIQTDLKTFQSFGVHGCSAVTALTAQNSVGVFGSHVIPGDFLRKQLDTLDCDLPPSAVKLGMLGSLEAARTTADFLKMLGAFVVCDPVMVASSGDRLSTEETLQIYRDEIFPLSKVVTPNVTEAELFTDITINGPDEMIRSAHRLLEMGPRSVLIKGGHIRGNLCQDYWTDGKTAFWLNGNRQERYRSHGTGCTLSSAIAAGLALDWNIEDALVAAKIYVTRGLRIATRPGNGAGILGHADWTLSERSFEFIPNDMCWISRTANEGEERLQFPKLEPSDLKFYPVVDSVEWVQKLVGLEVPAIQLRIKDWEPSRRDKELSRAIVMARGSQSRLFINDYWESAIQLGAFGVHLGQEDLKSADLKAIAEAGLKLGISSHSLSEIARAVAFRPSYVAIGSIFPTTKEMPTKPVGVESLRQWRRFIEYPVVAIGGITLETAGSVFKAGADSVAVIRDLVGASDPDARCLAWTESLRRA
jgi:hydroxymethylpyrimidine kinase / phosphomethylpyrimidine kinase / thiamine-phosphate diphosphorylase